MKDNKKDNIWHNVIKCIFHILWKSHTHFHPTPVGKTVVGEGGLAAGGRWYLNIKYILSDTYFHETEN